MKKCRAFCHCTKNIVSHPLGCVDRWCLQNVTSVIVVTCLGIVSLVISVIMSHWYFRSQKSSTRLVCNFGLCPLNVRCIPFESRETLAHHIFGTHDPVLTKRLARKISLEDEHETDS